MASQRGFTLVEMLVAMSLLVILSSLSVFLVTSQQTTLNEHRFITQLEADLYYAQALAIANQLPIQVRIYPNMNRYNIRGDINTGNIVDRYYDENIVFLNESTLSFSINANGNFSKFGTYEFRIGKQAYKLTIQIGKGRFYATKL
ncbi:competence type IV pilus minor pilin ComGD [Niallia sp. FSL W8-0635]|uniref:competence type IV pilus minor pilin ComGD n=1 Tax=Niallia sp. FSL W8-0635 TaxID=2975337 RepID=UPI0009D1C147|nr:Tfp pilus assembly protein FimT [Mycobacteroides abscessus subsp. abscessus]HEO8418665.1 prepilin-type N-terminal cleavage/methylation domain-containing protein [Yersinia enterocolitica]